MGTLSSGKDLLFILVLKVGWAAALAALLVRFRLFRKLLFTEDRDSDQKVQLLLFLTPPLAWACCCGWSATASSISRSKAHS